METTIFVAGTPFRGASNICFEFSVRALCFLKCAAAGVAAAGEGICDEKVWSRVGVGASKSMGCCGWCSGPEEFEFVRDAVPPPLGSRM